MRVRVFVSVMEHSFIVVFVTTSIAQSVFPLPPVSISVGCGSLPSR